MNGGRIGRLRGRAELTVRALATLGALHLVVALPALVIKAMRRRVSTPFPGVGNFRMVTATLWRGAAPTATGYGELAAAGVARVVDLRAEADVIAVQQAVAGLGLEVVSMPIRDGQVPTVRDLEAITAVVAVDEAVVFVHCGAGVGRTGSVIAALRVAAGAVPVSELVQALSHGPLSLEQQVFILRPPGAGRGASVPRLVIAVSRVIDSPRRLLARLRS